MTDISQRQTPSASSKAVHLRKRLTVSALLKQSLLVKTLEEKVLGGMRFPSFQ